MTLKLSTDQVNYANIGLMILSAALAFIIPFELFLFAYAVLGPLHYLTEISWLHDRKYFTSGKNDYILLVVLCVFITAMAFTKKGSVELATCLIYVAFGSGLIMIYAKKISTKALLIFLLFISAIFISRAGAFQILLNILLPTIVHVFLFTGAFILYGALKSKSNSGYLSLMIFILCAVSFFVWTPEFKGYAISKFVHDSYDDFSTLNSQLLEIFRLHPAQKEPNPFDMSAGALMIMRFIAFAYTYHYLNWFSKTSIIKWHEISKTRIAAIFLLWFLSLGIYAYDYYTGLMTLYFLSFLHVFLEFPLNHQSFIGIGKELRLRFSRPLMIPKAVKG